MIKLQASVTAAGSILSGALETAGVDQQGGAECFADGNMSMSKDNAVGDGEPVQKPLVDIVAGSGAMGDCDGVSTQDYLFFFGQNLLGRLVAHISANSVDIFSSENI